MTRRWYDFKGGIVELAEDVQLTMYNGLNHALLPPSDGAPGSQMLTKCGKRACPGATREVPGRGPVDCADCLDIPERLIAAGIAPCTDNEGDEHTWGRLDAATIICDTCYLQVLQAESPDLYVDMVLAYAIAEPTPEQPEAKPAAPKSEPTTWWEEV